MPGPGRPGPERSPGGDRRRRPGPGPPAGRAPATWWSSWAGRPWPRTAPWWPRRPSVWPGPCPSARFLPALRRGNVHGALDMGLAPGMLPGRVTLDDGREWFTQAWGSVPGHRGRDTAGILAAAAGDAAEGARVRSLVLLGADPAGRLPRPPAGPSGPSTGPSSWWRWPRPRARSPRPPTWCCPAAEAHERPGNHHQPRGPGQPAGPEAGAARPGLARLDDRRRAGRPPRRRPRPRLGRRRVGRDRAAGSRLPRHHPGRPRQPRGRRRRGRPARGHAPSPSAGRGAAPRLDPIAVPGVESVERQGAPPRAGLAEAPTAGLAVAAAPRRRPRPPTTGPARARPSWPVPSTRPSPRGPERPATRSVWWPPGSSTTRVRRWSPCRPWPTWSAPPPCGPTRSTSTSSGCRRAARSGCARPPRRPS